MYGQILGINLDLDEVVTHRDPPRSKTWETVGNPNLIVIGEYQLGFDIRSVADRAELKVFIDYNLPRGGSRWLGQLLGDVYAKWCVRQMLGGTKKHFAA